MEHNPKAWLCFTLLVLSVTILAAASAMAAKVYRWVDKDGAVHYSETLPPDFEESGHDELDNRGIVRAEDLSMVPVAPKPTADDESDELPRDSSGMKRPKALFSDREMQKRMDNFLLLRYGSEQAILDAMAIEINQLEYDRILLQTSQQSMSDAYRGQIREAANRQRSGLAVDLNITNSISYLQARLETFNKSLADLQLREDEITADYAAQLERYQSLIQGQFKGS